MEKRLRGHIIRRNICYWGSYAEKMLLMTLGMSAVYGLIFYGASSRISIYANILFYMMLMGLMFMMMIQVNYASSGLPLTLSFGSGRKESVWGMQFANLIFYLQLLLAFGVAVIVLLRCIPEEEGIPAKKLAGVIIGLFAALLLFAAAIGQFGTLCCLRFGPKGGGIFFGCFFVLIFVCIFLFMFHFMGQWSGEMEEERIIKMLRPLSIAAGIVGGILYTAGLLCVRRFMQNYEVRR